MLECVSLVEIFVKYLPVVRILLLLQRRAERPSVTLLTDIDEVETFDISTVLALRSITEVSTYYYKPNTKT